MRLSVLIFSILLGSLPCFAQEQVSGFVHRFGGELLITLNSNTGVYYRLQSSRTDTAKTLSKLATGDFVMATALVDSDLASIDVDTIDFVGLRKIIGFWNTSQRSRLMNFRSYSDLNIYDFILNNMGEDQPASSRTNLKYTVVPSQGSEWIMFVSDNRETQMAYLNLSSSRATLRFVNSRTGETTSTLQLHKIQE